MNRLATTTPQPRRSGLATVLEHLADSHPDEHASALAMLADPTWGHTQIADALTRIAREDNLTGPAGAPVRVTEKSIRDYRKENGPRDWQSRRSN